MTACFLAMTEVGNPCVSHVSDIRVVEFMDSLGLGKVHHFDIGVMTSLKFECQLVGGFQKLVLKGLLLSESMVLATHDVICLLVFIK